MVAARIKVPAHRLFFTSYTRFSTPTREVAVLSEALGRARMGWRGCRRRAVLREGQAAPGKRWLLAEADLLSAGGSLAVCGWGKGEGG